MLLQVLGYVNSNNPMSRLQDIASYIYCATSLGLSLWLDVVS